ncbi:MAG: response regulator transcription factor [Firmicutes bacterium]|nr:response regulator transcription factor [Bacillota bacterium]MCL5040182.1 response regulator transcription factor [Bacillota bacterium]
MNSTGHRLRAVVVDDEEYVRQELAFLLENSGAVEVVGQAGSVAETLALLRQTEPDVLFLDIHLPGSSGLELAAWLRELPRPPLVVFTTAYSQHAVDAFGLNAVDYVLKPYTAERLEKTIKRLQALTRMYAQTEPAGEGETAREKVVYSGGTLSPTPRSKDERVGWSKLAIPRGEGYLIVDYEEVYWFESRWGGVYLHTENETFLVPGTLRDYEERLKERLSFFRCHRHLLVNLEHA